jgi:hypothetical protein
MPMNWDAVAATGEWVGAIAVVISIVFLTLQVRSNTRAVRGRAAYDANNSWADLSQEVAFRAAPEGAEFAELIGKVHEERCGLSDLSTGDLTYMGQIWRSLMYRLEAQYWLAHHGLLARRQWEVRARWIRGLLELPAPAEWWADEKLTGLYSAEFVAALLSTTPSVATVAPTHVYDGAAPKRRRG